jgi:hypothetical protein
MPRVTLPVNLCLLAVLLAVRGFAQQGVGNQATPTVPNLVRFSGTLTGLNGKPLTNLVGVTFFLYADPQGGPPLWTETQNIQPDSHGCYTVVLGSTTSQGLPASLFASGEARWLGVQAQGYEEQPRILLLSVPYALKAGDAATVGGLPPSAFVLAAPGNSGGAAGAGTPSTGGNDIPNIGGSGAQNFIPIWIDNNGDLGNSVLFQSGTGSSAKTGVNTTTPAATLDVNGGTIARGPVQLSTTGTANASQGFNSQPFSLLGSVFNSSSQQAISPVFQWQTEPSGNNSSNPAETLNLLYGNGSGSPGETGLNIANSGKITFAPGQTFPGAGTITEVTAGAGLTGGGTSGNVTLSINTSFANQNYARLHAANTFTVDQTVAGKVNATQLISTAMQGTAPFQVNSTTQVSNLNASLLGGFTASAFQPTGSYATLGSNSFNGNQSVTGNISATGSVVGGSANFTGLVTEAGALLPASGTATATQGFNSQPADSLASVFNSNTQQATNQTFRWLAEPVGNNSGSPTGKLNLLFGANGGTPIETGLSVANNGQITFATGQTFPGAGNGTITGVTAGTGLIGGGTSGNVTLNVDTTQVVTGVVAGTDLSGGGTGGVQTLNLDTTKVPQLSSNNSFTGAVGIGAPSNPNGWTPLALGSANNFGTWMTLANTSTGGHTWNILSAGSGNAEGAGNLGLTDFTGKSNIFLEGNIFTANIASSGTVGANLVSSNSGFNIGGQSILYGVYGLANVFLGFNVGNTTMTGGNNLGTGVSTLWQNTTGSLNTALGEFSLYANSSGSENTAAGYNTLSANTAGIQNTAVGSYALESTTSANFNTAVGAHTMLSDTTGASNAAFGQGALYSNTTGSGNTGVGSGALSNNQTGSNNTALGVDSGPPTIFDNNLSNTTAIGALAAVTTSNSLVLGSINGVNNATSDTNVGIGTTAPQFPLTVVGNSTFSPVLVTTANSFGTWLQLGNTSPGGHTWNILSAGNQNAEGAGNIGITDLTGKSTIWLEGNVHVSGNLSKGGGSFKIDHPLDPAHKYLSHSFVESPDMMNVYNGNVTTDRHGVAVVKLPEYFGALNRDFRYQLTVIGQFAQAIVAREIEENSFTIRTDHPGVKVSWQVTGIRQDAYANAYRIPTEEEKPSAEQDHYLNPELFGASPELGVGIRQAFNNSDAAHAGLALYASQQP